MILVDTSGWIDFFNGAATPRRHELHELRVHKADIPLTGLGLTEDVLCRNLSYSFVNDLTVSCCRLDGLPGRIGRIEERNPTTPGCWVRSA